MGQTLTLVADVGGFGVDSDFSWQTIATYAFSVNCLGTPMNTVVGYRALAVDYSENGSFGENGIDHSAISPFSAFREAGVWHPALFAVIPTIAALVFFASSPKRKDASR